MASLRERKKAATRQTISDAATRLFEARGYEAVTLAEIADAAGVAQKTIWNYFGSKEDLFFDAEPAVLQALVGDVGSFRALLDRPVVAGPCGWEDLDGALYDGIRTWLRCEHDSPTLRARRVTLTWEWAGPLGAAAGSVGWGVLAAATLLHRHETMRTAMLAGLKPAAVRDRVRQALDVLGQEKGPPGGGPS